MTDLTALRAAEASFEADPSEVNGRALLAAREAASVALAALWAAFPDERPPTQKAM